MVESSGYEKCAFLYDFFDKKENIGFYLSYALPAGEILDVGAGTGRIAIPMAKSGIKIFCVEPSPAMRREFRKKLLKLPKVYENIQLFETDAVSFDLKRRFRVAMLSGIFDHFLTDDERLTVLYNINRHLVNKGKLVFDIFLNIKKDEPLAPAGVVKKGIYEYKRFVGGKVLEDKKVKQVELVFEIYRSGELIEKIEEKSIIGITNRENIHRLLIDAGFEVKGEFSDYNLVEYSQGDPLLIIEAVKK